MSNQDFQDRLQRINAGKDPMDTRAPGASGHRRGQKPDYRLIGAGGALMGLGLHGLRLVNQHYEAIRDGKGIAAAAGAGLGSTAILLVGIYLILRGAYKGIAAAGADTSTGRIRTPSRATKLFWSLLGFAMGTIANLYMFSAAAARFINTEHARFFSTRAALIAIALALVAVLIGATGLFLRGRGLGRVPVYFLCGGALTYATFRLMEINLLQWPNFVARLQ